MAIKVACQVIPEANGDRVNFTIPGYIFYTVHFLIELDWISYNRDKILA